MGALKEERKKESSSGDKYSKKGLNGLNSKRSLKIHRIQKNVDNSTVFYGQFEDGVDFS